MPTEPFKCWLLSWRTIKNDGWTWQLNVFINKKNPFHTSKFYSFCFGWYQDTLLLIKPSKTSRKKIGVSQCFWVICSFRRGWIMSRTHNEDLHFPPTFSVLCLGTELLTIWEHSDPPHTQLDASSSAHYLPPCLSKTIHFHRVCTELQSVVFSLIISLLAVLHRGLTPWHETGGRKGHGGIGVRLMR